MMPPIAHQRREGGFILPGVVMFVLALTIIGFSLFSLSSYEAQFMYASMDDTEAFYDASSAIDRGRFLAAATGSLASVKTGLTGTGNIVYAVAKQGDDSTGTVKWGGDDPVLIRVEVNRNGKKRLLEATFDPNMNPYDNLASCSSTERGFMNSRQTYDGLPDWDPHPLVQLTGRIWQTYSKVPPEGKYDWSKDIYPSAYGSLIQVTLGIVPPPQVTTFYNAHEAGVTAPDHITGGGNNRYNLDASGDSLRIKFFRSKRISGEDWSFKTVNTGNPIDLDVDGVAIWMFESGFYSAKPVAVHGQSDDMLVLIAKKTNDSSGDLVNFYGIDDVGFVFAAGLDSPDVPVIIVTDGYVAIDALDGPATLSIKWLSIYANFGWVRGPDSGTIPFTYSHIENAQASAEQNLQNLLDNGYLPNANPKRRQLTFIPGTWQELGTN